MELLEKHFEIALETPDGITRLRELILKLAMQGKLVDQNTNDRSADKLLQDIEIEKAKLIKLGVIKKQAAVKAVSKNEIPYELPRNWRWTRFKAISHDWGQTTPNKRFTYIDVGSINNVNGRLSPNTQEMDCSEAPSRARKIVKQNTVIFSTVRPYLMNIAIIDRDFAHEPIASTAFAILHPYSQLESKFIYYYLHSRYFISYVESMMKGVAYPAINDQNFYSGYFPLPPQEEQKRIVEKIDQLMQQCDKLEVERNLKKKLQLQLNSAATYNLINASDDSSFNKAWGFITNQFDTLYKVKQNVTDLKKSILQLALMGKLVPQNPNLYSAKEELEVIRFEKDRLIREGKIKKKESYLPIRSEEIIYQLPKGWAWCRLGEIVDLITKGSSPKWQGVNYIDKEEVLFVTSENVDHYKLDLTKKKFVEYKFNEIEPRSILKKGDYLMNIVGASIGRTAVYDLDSLANINQAVCLIRKTSKYIDDKFLLYFFNSPLCISYMYDKQVENARPNLSMSNISKFVLPFPSLEEQKRIVEKIESTLNLCDTLEKNIELSSKKQSQILNAVLAQV